MTSSSDITLLSGITRHSFLFRQEYTTDIISSDAHNIIEKNWLSRSEDTYDSEIIFVTRVFSKLAAVRGQYKHFYAANYLYRDSDDYFSSYPLAVGAHVLLRLTDDDVVLFVGAKDRRLSIPGGVMDAGDISSDEFDPRVSACRELHEETGIARSKTDLTGERVWFDRLRPHVFFTYECKIDLSEYLALSYEGGLNRSDFLVAGRFHQKHLQLDKSSLSKSCRASLV